MNASDVILCLLIGDHVKLTLIHVHWLPVEYRTFYKLCIFMHYVHSGHAMQYLTNCVTTVSAADASVV